MNNKVGAELPSGKERWPSGAEQWEAAASCREQPGRGAGAGPDA